jgi:hypothetical protein
MMAAAVQWEKLLGEWSGTNQLWLAPAEGAYESDSTVLVSLVAQGQFISIVYTWAFESAPQDGLIVFRAEIDQNPTAAVWLDSWHMKNDMMPCDGTRDDRGVVSLQGSYAAPSGPDWGWRIEVECHERASLVVRMINITPEGQDELAVLAQYQRSND